MVISRLQYLKRYQQLKHSSLVLAVFTQLATMESIFVLHTISQPSLQRRFIFGCEFLKKIIFTSMASHLGLAFFSRDQRQLGKDLLIVYAKCLFLVGVLYFISLFRILTARENLFIHSRQYHEKAIQSWLYRIKF